MPGSRHSARRLTSHTKLPGGGGGGVGRREWMQSGGVHAWVPQGSRQEQGHGTAASGRGAMLAAFGRTLPSLRGALMLTKVALACPHAAQHGQRQTE